MSRIILITLLSTGLTVGCGAKPESRNPDSAQVTPEAIPTVEPSPVSTPRQRPQLSRREYERRLKEELPEDLRRFLEQAEIFEVLSVSGVTMHKSDSAEEFVGAGRFGYSRIRGVGRITDSQVRKDLLEAFYDGLVEPSTSGACFFPQHAIRATSGERVVEITICFHCMNFYGNALGKQIGGVISRSPQEVFDHILLTAGVQLN